LKRYSGKIIAGRENIMENKKQMTPFLQTFAVYLEEFYSTELDSSCIVFPNRRAGLFFKKYYAGITSKAGWLPEILTIGDFSSRLSGIQAADPLEISFEAYRCFKKITGSNESYDEFYPWGELMIGDFDDIDKYLVDASQLFRNVSELKDIDMIFDFLNEDQKNLLRRFWKTFNEGKLSEQKESFLRIWQVLHPIYIELRKNLLEKNLGYEGMIYRNVAEDRITNADISMPWKRIFICGFNALSKSEEKIFSFLRDRGVGKFFWDYENSYISDQAHEAGRFMRRNIRSFPQEEEFGRRIQNIPAQKNVTLISLPSDVLQAKELNNLGLDKGLKNTGMKIRDFNETAIILGDESLLPSVLTSLPAEVDRLNITMGYPVSQTPVYSFIETVLKLQQYLHRHRKSGKYYFRDVISLLNHQYIKSFYALKTDELVAKIHRENKIYLDNTDFEHDALFRLVFSPKDSVNEIIDYLLEVFDLISNEFPADASSARLEKEYIFLISTKLNKLKNLFEDISGELTIDSFIRLFRKVLTDFRIPFEGEPLQGLQIMGILESRLLDFQNVIFLSMNEGVMPASSAGFSYIPANLRFAFGMPVREDKDAIYAYYFYRLLNRAEEITIMYNNQAEGLKSGEPSRYIHQIEYLSNWKLLKKTRAFRVNDKEPVKINVKKTEEVLRVLEKFTRDESDKYLSPSALITFMDCSLRFYFSYVAGIKEEDEATEEIDASGFGSLYHKTLELIYKDFAGKEISDQILTEQLKEANLKKHLDQAFREEFLKIRDKQVEVKPEGRNIIIYQIIRKLVIRTLENDRALTPFLLKETEQHIKDVTLSIEGAGPVRLGGKIDRLDLRESSLHIIDYKTGSVSLKFPGIEILFERESWPESENLKGIFQIFMYSWLYAKKNPGVTNIIPSIYPTRELFNQDFSCILYDKSIKQDVKNYLHYNPEFEEGLEKLVSEIFNREIDFQQTEDEKRCKNCPYKEICHRP
jgi:CRISPR/Cas system-associated exonuclease Cas4 (RecB family)